MEKIQVLVVDDEPEICNLLSREISRNGYEVVTALTAEEGLEKIKENKFAVILSDIKLPEMGGIAFLKEIKKNTPEIEIIMVTGYASIDNVMDAFKAGACDYILKPFSEVEVHYKVQKASDKYFSSRTIKLLNANIIQTYIELEKFKDSLEEKVQERTKELSLSEKKYRSIIDNSFDPIIVLDKNRQIIMWNKGAEITFGYSLGEVKGKPIEMLFFLYPEKTIKSINEKIKADGFIKNYIIKCITKTNKEIDVNITASSLGEDDICVIMRDITRERKVDEMKSDFVSNVSHELRTPLTSIKGAVELILLGAEGPVTDSQKDMLNIVKNNTVRLIKLIGELLDLSKIESGKIEMEIKPNDILQTIHATIREIKAVSDKKNIIINMSGPEKVSLINYDENKIKQVIVNLLSNAIKFTPEKGIITVSVEERNAEIEVSIIDSGIGIAKEHFEVVFEKFRQVDSSSTRAAGGTGLGLSIAKSIIEAHNGRIKVDSVYGEGSTFSFILKKDEQQKIFENNKTQIDKKENHALIQNQNFKIKRILVVDDDKDLANIIKGHLQNQGYEIFTANSDQDAVKMAVDLQPDLITLDILMQEMDGYFVTKFLRQNPETKDIPIVIISAFFEKEKTFKLGIADYITKPFDEDVIIECVKRIEKQIRGEIIKKKVLIVDDDPDIITLMTFSLTNKNYTVYNAYEGIQAIALAKKEKPNIIILDLTLPSMDGFAVIKALKNDPEISAIPIVVITGHSIEDKEKAIELGAREYFIKPFTMRMLYEELDKILMKEFKIYGS